MSVEMVRSYLEKFGLGDRILTFDVSSATVDLAAKALGTEPEHIAKSLTFLLEEQCVMIVCAGDAKVDNAKYKAMFGKKASMMSHQQALVCTGHAVGGICPFALPSDVLVFLDESLKRFDTVYPAAGTANSCVRLTPNELFSAVPGAKWVDLCKNWQAEPVLSSMK